MSAAGSCRTFTRPIPAAAVLLGNESAARVLEADALATWHQAMRQPGIPERGADWVVGICKLSIQEPVELDQSQSPQVRIADTGQIDQRRPCGSLRSTRSYGKIHSISLSATLERPALTSCGRSFSSQLFVVRVVRIHVYAIFFSADHPLLFPVDHPLIGSTVCGLISSLVRLTLCSFLLLTLRLT